MKLVEIYNQKNKKRKVIVNAEREMVFDGGYIVRVFRVFRGNEILVEEIHFRNRHAAISFADMELRNYK